MNYGEYIEKSDRVVMEDFKGNVPDIIDTILDKDVTSAKYTVNLAPLLKGDTPIETFRNIYDFVRREIRYVSDGESDGIEKIKSPGATWRDRYADCKSMAIFVGSILQNLGYNYFYRVAFYDEDQPHMGHIYVVAQVPGGNEVAIDPVNENFNEQPKWWRKMDKVRIQSIEGFQGVGDMKFTGTQMPFSTQPYVSTPTPQQPAMQPTNGGLKIDNKTLLLIIGAFILLNR